jgi:hypothetical protein
MKGDYIVVYDTRTHPLSIFTSSASTEIMHNKVSEAARKILHNLRDKWSESNRAFVPRLYRTPETWRSVELNPNTRIESRPGIVFIQDNRPLFSTFPLWNPAGSPVLSLLLRVPDIYKWIITRPDIVKELCSDCMFEKRDWLHYIEDIEGQGPLQSIGFRQTTSISIPTLIPKATTLIPFEEFDMILSELTTTLTEEAFFKCLDQYDIHPDHALVTCNSRTLKTIDDLSHGSFKLSAWIDTENTLHQLYIYSGKYYVISQAPNSSTQHFGELAISNLSNVKLMLWQTPDLHVLTEELPETIQRTFDGVYVRPEALKARSIIIPFREPMSCTAIEIEKLHDEDFPVIAQEKLDGNRIIVHVLDCMDRPMVRYFSRSGVVQTEKFNEHFDSDVIAFCRTFFGRAGYSYKNVMLDCECYARDVIHAEIGGLCNRIAISEDFRKLKLFVLSMLDLDALRTERLRGREYTVNDKTFNQVLLEDQELLRRTENEVQRNGSSAVCLNYSCEISSRAELYGMMSHIVEQGGEGIVLYPINRPYTFANAGLKKVKKFFDGECVVLSYKASNTSPTEIGSVLVSTRPYFSKTSSDSVTFYVNAALRQEVKDGSMTSVHFANCIGKQFTIICGSFSDEGVPIHARFKASFGLGNERTDI